MCSSALRFLPLLLTILYSAAAANLTSVTVSVVRTPGCTRPPAMATLLPTDPNAYVYFGMSGVALGDQAKLEIYGPSGALLKTSTFAPATQTGSFCYWVTIDLGSAAFNHALGRYTAKGYWNDDPTFTVNFWIQNPGLTMEEKIFDFQSVASLYAKRYAPYDWKKQLFGYDALDLRPWLDKVAATTGDMDYLDLIVQYVAALNDTHCTYRIPSTFSAYLGFGVDIYWDEGRTQASVLIDSISRTQLSSTTYPFQIGDELVSIDGVPVVELMDGFKKYISAASADSGRRRAASYLTSRSQSALPLLDQLGTTALVEIRRQSGALERYTIPWSFSGVAMRRIGPVQPPVTARSVRPAGEEVPPYMRTLMKFRNEKDESAGEILNYGSLPPVWTLPEGFTQRLGRSSITDNFFTGTFAPGNARIGYLRLPHFSPSSSSAALAQLEKEITFFQDNTDALVVDVMRNTGGDPCYGEQVLRRLIPREWKALGRTIRPVWDDITGFQSDLTLSIILGAPKATLDLLQARLDDLTEAYNSDRGVTPPVATCAPNLDRTPATVVYDKPILLLVDEFSTSAADGFSAQFQDNARGRLFGWRTNGAGGGVLNETPGYYSEGGTARVVVSMHYRPNMVRAAGYPATHFVENVGVQPDIAWNYMRKDNLVANGRLFVDAFLAEIAAQVAGK